jgi:hypothetical protein
MINDMTLLVMPMPIRSAYQDAMKDCKNELKKVMNSFDMFAMDAELRIMLLLPSPIVHALKQITADLFTVLWSNANMSKIAFAWDGKKVLGQFYFGSAGGGISTFINLCTIGPYTSLSCYADENSIKYP